MAHTSTEQQLKDIEQALRLAREAHQHEVDAYRPELYKPECDRRPKYQLDRLGDLICLLQNILYAAQQASRRVQERGVAQAQQGLDAETQRNADIGAAVLRACEELPEGAEIQIYLERGAGTVHMTDWDGNEFDPFDEDHEDFACRINAATDGAIAAEKAAAQANQGGA